MKGTHLKVPHEPRFVAALALAVEPTDTLSLLLEIGALRDRDLGPVRRTREALRPAYEQAADAEDWELAHTASLLEDALGEAGHAAYLACQVRPGLTPAVLAEALATIGCAAESRQRPWAVGSAALFLDAWRDRVGRLLLFRPLARLLPAPAQPPDPTTYTITAAARLLD